MYAERSATPDLAGRVACEWVHISETVGSRLVVPDACVDLIWGPEGLFVAGPDTGPMPAAVGPGEVLAGIRFRPGAAGGVFGLPLPELRDQRVALSDLPDVLTVTDALLPTTDVPHVLSLAELPAVLTHPGPRALDEAASHTLTLDGPTSPGAVFDGPAPRARAFAGSASVEEAFGPAPRRRGFTRSASGGEALDRPTSDGRALAGTASGGGAADRRGSRGRALTGSTSSGRAFDGSASHARGVYASARGDAVDVEARLDLMRAAVRSRLTRMGPGATDPAAPAIAAALRAGRSVAEVARDLGYSERQLHRRGLTAFGYAPKTLQRILRFQHALRLARAGVPLAEVAVTAGYADQAHLAHDVRRLSGVPMRSLLSPARAA
ncbi:helix-turn-helix domain-containing protein [Nonomuraea terrae]|nr:helix-turn-helix domain-containing protein [Nonomuraea terrae]